MNCYEHPSVGAVAACGNCGVGMCKECVDASVIAGNEGAGAKFCKNCSKPSVNLQTSNLGANTKMLFMLCVWYGIGTFCWVYGLIDGTIKAGSGTGYDLFSWGYI